MKPKHACLSLLGGAAILLNACQPSAAPAPPATAVAGFTPTTKPPAAPPAVPAATAGAMAPSPMASPAAAAAVSPLAVPSASVGLAQRETFDQLAVANFYRGKAIRMRIGLPPGGGYDLYTRTIARHIGSHIPGNPNVIAENFPGGGGALLAADTYNRGAKDGTELSIFPGSLFLQRLLGDTTLGFDVPGWSFIGAPGISEYICETQDRSGITAWSQLVGPNARQAVFGEVPGLGETVATIVKDTTGANLKIVTGYAGTAPVRLAMEQGEVDGQCAIDWSSLVASSLDDLKTGKHRVILQLTTQPKAGVPQGDAPTIYGFIPSAEDRALVKAGIEDPGIYGRPYVVPPGVPADRIAVLRQAFNETMVDPAFLAEANTTHLDINPRSGRELDQLIADLQHIPDSVKARLKKYYNVPG